MAESTALALAEAPQTTQAAPAVQSIGEIMSSADMLHQIDELAKRMAAAKIAVPQHFRGSPGDCAAVIMQAVQWRINPYALAQKTHVVNGALGYEAQLVNAVVTSMAPTQDRLNYEWFGDWSKVDGKKSNDASVGVRVFATMKGEAEPRVLEVTMAQVGTVRNSPLWQSDPRQQLAYLAAKRWARLHCPDVILGVYTPDELHEVAPRERDVTPQRPQEPAGSRTAELKARLAEEAAEDVPAEEVEPAEKAPDPYMGPTFAEISEQILACDTLEECSQVSRLVAEFGGHPDNEAMRGELADNFRARRDKLKAAAEEAGNGEA